MRRLPLFEVHDLSDRRRVLAASDVHGALDLLEEKLDELGWDPSVDALVLNGDLVDRGPRSLDAVAWSERPGVLRLLGNHEHFIRDFMSGDVDEEWMRETGVGADWFCDLPDDEQRRVHAILRDAPVAMQVRTPLGRNVGFTHADCPGDWTRLREALTNPSHPERGRTVIACLESRSHGRKVVAGCVDGRPSTHRCPVEGIDHVFHGHTIFGRPFVHDNRSWIDTGAATRGVMTVVDVDAWIDDADRHRLFQ